MSPGKLFAGVRLPFLLLGLLLVAVLAKLVLIQIVKRERYEEEVDRAVLKTVAHPAERGRIFDRSGRVLADNRGTVHLVADCRELDGIESRNIYRLRKKLGLDNNPDEAWKAQAKLQLRAELVAGLACALRSTIGAGPDDAEKRALDLAERLGKRVANAKTGQWEGSTHVVLARELSPDEESAVRDVLREHRVTFAFQLEEDFERIYPAGPAASSVLGFVGARRTAGSPKESDKKENQQSETARAGGEPQAKKGPQPERIGRGGVESKFEESLRGEPGKETVLRAPTARGGMLDIDRASNGIPGADYYLTIDSTISAILHEELLRADREFPCEHGITGIVLHAKTGEVLAMDTVPSFDPNAAPGEKNHPLTNKALVAPYEPGSAIKPFTVAAALEAGAVHVNDTFFIHGGSWQIPGRRKPIKDSHFDPAHNIQSVGEILARSSNVGAVQIGQRAGAVVLESAFARYGFREACGIELPGEARPRLPRRENGQPWDVPNRLSSVAFGYEMMVSPIRFAAAYAMLANGGMRVEPRLISSVRLGDGTVRAVEAPPSVRVMPADVADTVRRLCQGVVTDEHGTAYKRAQTLRQAGYAEVDTFAGKTGSAVIPQRPDRINGTFACFGPMPDPELVVLFVAFEPKGARFGGDICGQPALETLALSLRALGLTSPSPRRITTEREGIPAVEPVVLTKDTDAAKASNN